MLRLDEFTLRKVEVFIVAIAFFFSLYSLYLTNGKGADLRVYVAPVTYLIWEGASEEVVVLPLTVSNSGSREGAITDLTLQVKQGKKKSDYYAIYFSSHAAGEQHFVTEKMPFTPISVFGNSSLSRTVLFKLKRKLQEQIFAPGGDYELIISYSLRSSSFWGIDKIEQKQLVMKKCMTGSSRHVLELKQGKSIPMHPASSLMCQVERS